MKSILNQIFTEVFIVFCLLGVVFATPEMAINSTQSDIVFDEPSDDGEVPFYEEISEPEVANQELPPETISEIVNYTEYMNPCFQRYNATFPHAGLEMDMRSCAACGWETDDEEELEAVNAPLVSMQDCGESFGIFTVYAYCNCVKCCGRWSPYHSSRVDSGYEHRTASGTLPEVGRTIAADWSVLPQGTHVVIDGREYIVEDRGTGIIGNKLDVYLGDWMDGAHEEVITHGVREFEVFAVVKPSE